MTLDAQCLVSHFVIAYVLAKKNYSYCVLCRREDAKEGCPFVDRHQNTHKEPSFL